MVDYDVPVKISLIREERIWDISKVNSSRYKQYDNPDDKDFLIIRFAVYLYFSLIYHEKGMFAKTSLMELLDVIKIGRIDYKKKLRYKKLCEVMNWFSENNYIHIDNGKSLDDFSHKEVFTVSIGEDFRIVEAQKADPAKNIIKGTWLEPLTQIKRSEFDAIVGSEHLCCPQLLFVYAYMKSRMLWQYDLPKVLMMTHEELQRHLNVSVNTVKSYISMLIELELVDKRRLPVCRAGYPSANIYAIHSDTSDKELSKGVKYYTDFFESGNKNPLFYINSVRKPGDKPYTAAVYNAESESDAENNINDNDDCADADVIPDGYILNEKTGEILDVYKYGEMLDLELECGNPKSRAADSTDRKSEPIDADTAYLIKDSFIDNEFDDLFD